MSKDDVKPDWAMNKREKAAVERLAKGLPPKKRRRWPWLVGVLVVLALGAGWFVQSGKLDAMQEARDAAAQAAEAEAAKAAEPAVMQLEPFEVTTLAPTELSDTLRVTGSLAPVRQASISSEVTGRVLSVSVREGDAVTAGQVLVEFDTDTLATQLDQARSNVEATRAQLDQARTTYERTKSLVDRGLQAPNTLDAARASLDQLTASLAALETNVTNAQRSLDRATVTAPFDGYVSSRSVDPDGFVATGSPLVTVVDLTSLEVEATAPITASPVLKPGQEVTLTVEGFGDRRFEGKVDRLGPIAIEGSRMLPVYVTIDNASGELRGGMFTSGKILLDSKADVLGVPAGALRTDADGTYVLVVEDGKALRRAVTVARDWDGGAMAEISDGLAAGDVVVSEPLAELKADMPVELMTAK